MVRILTFLMVCTLIFSCTNTEERETTTQIDKNQIESSTDIVENQTKTPKEETSIQEVKEVEETVKEEPISKNETIETKKKTVPQKSYSSNIVAVGTIAVNTVFMSEEELAQFNKNANDNLTNVEYELPSANDIAALRQMLDDLVDEVEGFAAEEDTTTRVKKGAFNEVISVTKSGEDITDDIVFSAANSVDKNSLEYMKRPKPLVEYSGYKIELITVYNQSLDLNDPLFKTFGGLTFKNNTTNSTTYYLGDFKDIPALDDYLQKVVKSRFPKAHGVKFENGVEVKYK